MKCPICEEELVEEQPTEGCEMYVAEDTGCSTECADPDIKFYRCLNNHRIYIGT